MIDLHTHTINSDGDFTTEETIIEAEKKGIEILSITDHNNISAYEELKKLPLDEMFSGKIIIGTELEFTKDGRLFDMLGYGFDPNILNQTQIIREGMIHSTVEGQTIILNQLKKICDSLGIIYSKDLKIKSANTMANDVILDDILLFEQNKEILDRMGIYDRSSFYRKHFCEPKSPFYIDETERKFDVFYVTKIIHEAGGKTFLAHPFVYKLPDLKAFLDELVSYGILDGIECEHRKHSKEEIEWIEKYCDEHHLLKSGGSDRHTIKHQIGHANNNQREISRRLVENWIDEIVPFYEPKHQ